MTSHQAPTSQIPSPPITTTTTLRTKLPVCEACVLVIFLIAITKYQQKATSRRRDLFQLPGYSPPCLGKSWQQRFVGNWAHSQSQEAQSHDCSSCSVRFLLFYLVQYQSQSEAFTLQLTIQKLPCNQTHEACLLGESRSFCGGLNEMFLGVWGI